MKKINFIFLIIFGLFIFNITQASAGCNIVWSGYSSGSIPTNEISRTNQATDEAYHAICPTCGSPICDVPEMNPCGNELICFDYRTRSLSVCRGGSYYFAYWEGSWDVICESTLIELSSFIATPKKEKVILQWTTQSEIDNAGFNIYRAESENSNFIKLNASLITAKGTSTQGASYELVDTSVQNRTTYYYKLEDIDLNGTSTMHGPVSATPRLIYGIGK
jgi:hypothetical protein